MLCAGFSLCYVRALVGNAKESHLCMIWVGTCEQWVNGSRWELSLIGHGHASIEATLNGLGWNGVGHGIQNAGPNCLPKPGLKSTTKSS